MSGTLVAVGVAPSAACGCDPMVPSAFTTSVGTSAPAPMRRPSCWASYVGVVAVAAAATSPASSGVNPPPPYARAWWYSAMASCWSRWSTVFSPASSSISVSCSSHPSCEAMVFGRLAHRGGVRNRNYTRDAPTSRHARLQWQTVQGRVQPCQSHGQRRRGYWVTRWMRCRRHRPASASSAGLHPSPCELWHA